MLNRSEIKFSFLAHQVKGNIDILQTLMISKTSKLDESFPPGQFLLDGYNACTQTAIRFFFNEIKRPFVFLQQNTKFYSCIQTAIRFLEGNREFLKLYPNGHSYFPQGNTKSNYLSSI